jgi:hypothetical protein
MISPEQRKVDDIAARAGEHFGFYILICVDEWGSCWVRYSDKDMAKEVLLAVDKELTKDGI